MRQARYFGRKKTLFQLLLTATVANLTLIASPEAYRLLFAFVVTRLTLWMHSITLLVTLRAHCQVWGCPGGPLEYVKENSILLETGGSRPCL